MRVRSYVAKPTKRLTCASGSKRIEPSREATKLESPARQCREESADDRVPQGRHRERISTMNEHRHSTRNATIGSTLAARRAGINPANAAAADSTTTAIAMLRGSYERTP